MKTVGGNTIDLVPPETGHREGADDGSSDETFWRHKEQQFTEDQTTDVPVEAVPGRGYEMGLDGMPARTGRIAIAPFRIGAYVAQFGRVMARPETPGFGSGGGIIAA